MHWYSRDGESKYEIVGANGEFRATTLRDAKKLGLVPSVTTINAILSRPGLDKWKMDKLLDAAFTNRALKLTKERWSAVVRSRANEESSAAMKRGTQLHDHLEQFFKCNKIQEEEFIIPAIKMVNAINTNNNWRAEDSFAHPSGFGGKIDLHSKEGDGFIIDFKTKAFTEIKEMAYDEHAMQLAAYSIGLNLPKARCFNLFISTTKPGLLHLHEWKKGDIERAGKMFNHLLELWKLFNNFDSSF